MTKQSTPDPEIGETEEQSENPGIPEAMDLYEKDEPSKDQEIGSSQGELIIGDYPIVDQLE